MPKSPFYKLVTVVVVILTVAGVGYAGLMIWRDRVSKVVVTKELQTEGDQQVVGRISPVKPDIPAENGAPTELLSPAKSKASMPDTSDWSTHIDKELGFTVKYPQDWWIREWEPWWKEEPPLKIVEILPPEASGAIPTITIEKSHLHEDEMLEGKLMKEVVFETGRHPDSFDAFSLRKLGDHSFYYIPTGMFEGRLTLEYYFVKQPMIFIFSLITEPGGDRLGDPNFDIESEERHLALKGILSTFEPNK